MKQYYQNNIKDYAKVQSETNRRKLDRVWVKESEIQAIASVVPTANRILCHGTRNGKEQHLFQKYYPKALVIGTEISSTASQFPDTIKWDFHNPHPILNNEDIVYSNSLDHSHNPNLALKTWHSQLSDLGTLVIQHSSFHSQDRVTPSDCFSASLSEYIELISKHFKSVSHIKLLSENHISLIFAQKGKVIR
jgi:hypothetical protein